MGCTIELVVSIFWGTVENMCLLLRGQFKELLSYTTYAKPDVPAAAVARVDTTSIHVEEPHAVGIVPSRGPKVAASTLIVSRTTVVVA